MLSIKNPQLTRLFAKVVLSLVAIALFSLPATAQLVTQTNLGSDIDNVASQPTDPDLVNPWGIVSGPTSPWWISDNGTGKSTIYDGNGVKQGLVVDIPQWDGTPGGNPDGIVFNGTTDFKLSNGNPSVFLFATEDGTVQGWNGGTVSTIVVNNFPGSVYKGLALGSALGANYLYAANFRVGSVDVFDTNFQPHSFGSNAFVDNTLPSGYAPFNVANINGNIIVSYALQDAEKHDDVAGIGHGYIRVYDSQGNLLQRLPHIFQLNSPWAMTLAPSGWGNFSGKLMVGQFGSGGIIGFDLDRNTLEGILQDDAGLPIRINGLWGLSFGNGGRSGPTTTMYFTAGYFAEAHGLFGTITVSTDILSHPGRVTVKPATRK